MRLVKLWRGTGVILEGPCIVGGGQTVNYRGGSMRHTTVTCPQTYGFCLA
jgi:hypothetical protein